MLSQPTAFDLQGNREIQKRNRLKKGACSRIDKTFDVDNLFTISVDDSMSRLLVSHGSILVTAFVLLPIPISLIISHFFL